MRFRRAQNPQWQVRLFPPHLQSSTCKLRSGSRPQEVGAQGLFCGAQWDKGRLSLFGCEKFSTNAARGFASRPSWNVACPDDAADTTAELGCSNCCACLWVFHADRTGNEREARNLCCRTQGGRANLPRCVCLASTEQTTWYGVHGRSQLPFCSRTKSGRILYSSGGRQTKRDERPK